MLESQETSPFCKKYAPMYELVSSKIRSYERTAEALAGRLLDTNKQFEHLLELGSGTGNATTVFLETISSLQTIYCLEPSEFIEIAQNKQRNDFTDVSYEENKSAWNKAWKYVQEMSNRLQPHKEKLKLIRGNGHTIPLRDQTMEAITMIQVFHWLDMNTALSEFYRVLKPGGIIAFDVSGSRFDFGSEKEKLNTMHVTRHPFFILFQEKLKNILELKGIHQENTTSSPKFTEEILKKLFEEKGFIRIADKNRHPYTITIVPYTMEQIYSVAKYGTRMRIGRLMPELLATPELIDDITSRALEETKNIWEEKNKNIPYYAETFAAFIFQKQ